MPGKGKYRKKSRILPLFLSMLVFITGFSIYLYPYANGVWVDQFLRRESEEFLSFVSVTPETAASDDPQAETQATQPNVEEIDPLQYPELLQRMQAYNDALFQSGQEGLSDEDSYEQPSFILADYGLESEVFAVLSVPALNLEMPIYLGATKQHMAAGAAHMSQTSLPIGGTNTNCVISGHRGWNGAAYFLNIPNLKNGDIITITNLWETLTYQVVEKKIIKPHEVEAIRIQQGRELVTLLTCHPPATGGRERYLVFCERIETELEVP